VEVGTLDQRTIQREINENIAEKSTGGLARRWAGMASHFAPGSRIPLRCMRATRIDHPLSAPLPRRRGGGPMPGGKERVARGSVGVSAGLTAAKAVVGLASGSLAILSEAAHSLIDLAATSMTYFAIRISGKPADAEHHYGHGKVESVAALIETGFLF